jgi:alpha-N-arabinofuranosidase
VTKSGEYSVQDGITRLPEIADVPYLDVVAALNDSGDTLTLFCVNRHLTRDLDTAIRLKGFTARGDAEIQTLRADSIYERNDETDPENVIPQAGSARVSDGALAHTFPHESITVITLHKH